MTPISGLQFIALFQRLALVLDSEKDHLSTLDGVIGDGDHGITMSLGFRAINAEVAKLDSRRLTPSDVLSVAASAFLDAVGASTGPLYATAFQRASKALVGKPLVDLMDLSQMLQAFAEGIAARGKGQRGDKTMLDVWLPAAEAARLAAGRTADPPEFWDDIIAAATAGEAATRSMIATRGRAARLGQRSLGHTDPGAASAVLILQGMAAQFGGAEP
jgi:phosphoenolpyruvate---glycerone phosphotransferase subunit DhaL